MTPLRSPSTPASDPKISGSDAQTDSATVDPRGSTLPLTCQHSNASTIATTATPDSSR